MTIRIEVLDWVLQEANLMWRSLGKKFIQEMLWGEASQEVINKTGKKRKPGKSVLSGKVAQGYGFSLGLREDSPE